MHASLGQWLKATWQPGDSTAEGSVGDAGYGESLGGAARAAPLVIRWWGRLAVSSGLLLLVLLVRQRYNRYHNPRCFACEKCTALVVLIRRRYDRNRHQHFSACGEVHCLRTAAQVAPSMLCLKMGCDACMEPSGQSRTVKIFADLLFVFSGGGKLDPLHLQ